MELALHVPDVTWGGPLAPTLAGVARAADEGGFATLTLMDHWFQMESFSDPTDPMPEGYTTLGFLAGQTLSVQLGLLVTGVTYRHPGLLAKIVATLDNLSGGRALLGIGAAWYEREHRGLGVPFPPLAERFARLEEALQICRQMWSDDDGPYEGTYYELAETICNPRPLQAPRPPVLIGGSGEKKTLRLVARYADACNLFGGDHDEVARKLSVLDGHCEAEGRDPATVQRTVITMAVDPLSDDFLRDMEAYARLGVAKAWISAPKGIEDPVSWVRRVAEHAVPRLRELQPST